MRALPMPLTHSGRDRVLVGALVLGVAALLALVALQAPLLLLLAVPGAALGALAAAVVARSSKLNFILVMALSVLTIGFEEGIQLSEVFYGLYYVSYLAGWFFLRVFVYREPITRYVGDQALLAFLFGIVASTAWSFSLGGDLPEYIGGMSALAYFAFYFPMREACIRWDDGVRLSLILLFWIAVFVAVRNLMMYQELLAQAILANYIRNRRVVMNDNVLMASTIAGMALLSAATQWRYRLLMAACVTATLLALLITLSRAQWVTVLFGFGLIVLLGRGVQRRQALLWIVGGGVFVSLFLLVIAGNKVTAVLEGLTSRFASLSGASSRDLSLISRAYEARGALQMIRHNPVLGYGVGVPFPYFDIISQVTFRHTLIHNGYVSLWYRFGLWGPLLLFTAWLGAIRRGLSLWRRDDVPLLSRAAAFSCAIALICYFLSTMVANPFHNSDGILYFALMGGIASGTHARHTPRPA